jgi:cobaltochelatase CobN
MNPKIAIKATIAILVIALTISIASSDWSQFHHDPERTGNVSGDAPLTDTLLWATKPSSFGCIEGGVSIVGARVYVATCPPMGAYSNLGLFCLNNSTGEILWGNPLGGKGGRSTPATSGDLIFVGSCTGDLYCVNASDGKTIWNETIETSPAWWVTGDSPLVYEDKVFISGFSDGTLHAFDFDGKELWNITTGGGIGSYTSPAASDGRIFFAGGDPALYCVNISDHSILWNFSTSDDITTTPSIEGDVVFFATESRMYSVDMDGDEVWSHNLTVMFSSPAVAYGNVYIGSDEKKMHCFNASNGDEVWNKSVNGIIRSSPAVADGTVYFGNNTGDGTVYALNATDGTLRWSYDTGDYVMSSPSVSDGILFIGANNSSTNYTINRTTALGALVKAAGYGSFNFTINDSCLAFVDSIAEVSNNETDGKYWRYHVNYHPDDPEPTIHADKFELNASSTARDVVMFYYGNESITPENSTMAVQITTQIIEKKPEAIFITVERRDFIENTTENSNLNITLLPPSDVRSRIDLTGYDLIFLEHLSGTPAKNLKGPIETANASGIPIICINSEGYDAIFGNVNLTEHWFIEEYWGNYAEENIARLLTYLEVNFCGLIGNIEDPVPVPKAYIHHPDTAELFFDMATYLEWYANNTGNTSHQYDPCNLTIGVANWYTFTRSADVERLIHTLEQKEIG